VSENRDGRAIVIPRHLLGTIVWGGVFKTDESTSRKEIQAPRRISKWAQNVEGASARTLVRISGILVIPGVATRRISTSEWRES